MLRRRVARLALLGALAAPAAAFAAWPQLGGDAGRSGAEPVDPGEPPVLLAWQALDTGNRTSPLITSGAPDAQRVVYGAPAVLPNTPTRVVVRRLEGKGESVSETAVAIDDTAPTTNGFGANGSVTPAEANGIVYALHNDDGHVEIARIRASDAKLLDGPGADRVIGNSVVCTADSSPLITPAFGAGARALVFVTGGCPDGVRLWRVLIAPDGTLAAEDHVIVGGAAVTAAPALAYLRDATGEPRPHACIGAGNAVQCFRVDVPLDAPLMSGDLGGAAQGPAVPARADGALAAPSAALYVAIDAGGATTKVCRLAQADNAQALGSVCTSSLLAGSPAPGLAVTPLRSDGTVSPTGRVIVGTSTNLHLVGETDLQGGPGTAGDFSRTIAAVSGDLVYAQTAAGAQAVLSIASGKPVPAEDFAPTKESAAATAAYGQPAIARGYVAFASDAGVFVYRNQDATDPVVELLAPQADAKLAKVVTFRARAADARGIARVDFRLSGPSGSARVLGSDTTPDEGSPTDGGAVYSAAIQTGAVPNGTYIADAVAIDASGRTAASGRITVRVQNTTSGPNGSLKPGRCANDLLGGDQPDRLTGTSAGDRIIGRAGNDALSGAGGDDCLEGDEGNDRLRGNAGDDTLDGGIGTDVLDGDAGRDKLSGGGDRDVMRGGTGNDVLGGGGGRDDLRGGVGNDRLTGGSGDDVLRGEAGSDRLTGGAGNDRLIAGSGSNGINGGAGNDRVEAVNNRRDAITCGAGRDTVRADPKDRVSPNCERVTRKRPPAKKRRR